METLETLEKRIRNAEDLLSIVKTMRALAAADIRQYLLAVISLAEYDRTVDMALQVVLRHRPPNSNVLPGQEVERGERLGVVVFGSDQGLCGQFNERIADFTLDKLNGMQVRRQDRFMLSVGSHVTSRLRMARQPIIATFPVPSSVKGIANSVQSLLVHLETWQSEQDIRWVVLFYNRKTSDVGYAPHKEQLLPLDGQWLISLQRAPWPSRMLPIMLTEWHSLFATLVRQTTLVALHRAFAESLASENGSRLAAMQAAERNIGDHLEEFHMEYQRRRQEAITSELLDIVSGAEAVQAEYYVKW